MTPDRWQQIERLYHRAQERPAAERAAFLTEACAADDGLRREVEALLDSPVSVVGFLAAPPFAVPAGFAPVPGGSMLTGRRLGTFQLHEQIGAGGMGKVYRARDTRLGRDVAIKILPHAFTEDPDRLARFEREARILASLNHPNIATIHGVEEGEGVRALVMELVDGETLAARIRRGPVPVSEALPIARQIADALETAHSRGIIHRDLKPANIKITAAWLVKVLDFGLAKLTQAAGPEAPEASQAPTITVNGTKEGLIVGTAAYMSPEQARGQAVDTQTDIWAFGCVLYEMLTGTPPFSAGSMSDTIAKILEREPDWQKLPATTPATIRRLLRRCLAKDRRNRLSDAADARLEIEEAQTNSGNETAPPGADVRPPVARRTAAVAAGAALIAGATAAGLSSWLAIRPASPRVTRFTIATALTAPLTLDAAQRNFAISRDGRRLVYVAANGTQLVVRAFDQLVPTVLAGLDAPSQPVFSPDGQWIAFFDGANRLKKIPATGGTPVTLGPVTGPSGQGPSWAADDTIFFGSTAVGTGLFRVSAAGGEAEALTTLNREEAEEGHILPEVLPGGDAVLFTIWTPTRPVRTQVAVLNLRTRERKVLVRGGIQAQYAAPGYLVYADGGTLRAVAFDLGRLEVAGSPVPVVEGLLVGAWGRAHFAVSPDGTLVYLSGGAQRTLVWIDRQGREETLPAAPRTYVYPRLSPDGTRVAVSVTDQENDIWIWDLSRQMPLTRFTFDAGMDLFNVWTPDGRRLVWGSQRAGRPNLYWQAADGTGAVERLTDSLNAHYPMSIAPDGTRVVLREGAPGTGQDLMMIELGKEQRVTPLIRTAFNEQNGEVSPDGRWLAYESDESGQSEIYVRPFPEVDAGRWQVSSGGGRQPLWARSGREVFYRAPNGAVMGVSVEGGTSSGFSVGSAVMIVRAQYYNGSGAFLGRTYDVSPDGQRFLMIKEGGRPEEIVAGPTIVVVENWVEELKRVLPLGRN